MFRLFRWSWRRYSRAPALDYYIRLAVRLVRRAYCDARRPFASKPKGYFSQEGGYFNFLKFQNDLLVLVSLASDPLVTKT